MDTVAFWLIIDFILLIGFVIVGLFIERTLNHKAEEALTRRGLRAVDQFSIWVRNAHKHHPRALAAILSCPTFLCLSISAIVIFGVLPFPMSAEYAVPFLLLILYVDMMAWLLHITDISVGLRRKAMESMQSTDA